MSVVTSARASGKCPPSLLRDEPKDDTFEAAVAKVMDANGLTLSTGPQLVDDFASLLQTAANTEAPGDSEMQKAMLAQRRCIILALVGSTPSSNSSMPRILQNGYLKAVKSWLNDILSGQVGGVDLLLHLLSNITTLPVTKSVVKESGMGKLIGSVDKNSICAGSPNEAGIKERLKALKEAWNKSVKALKEKEPVSSAKRELERPAGNSSPPVAKKAKVDEKKKSSISSLINKIKPSSATEEASSKLSSDKGSPESKATAKKEKNITKASKRVKWADHFGGDLKATRIMEGDGDITQEESAGHDTSVSWSDKRRRDRLREKELLAQVKKSKLMDDDDDMPMSTPSTGPQIQPGMPWRAPTLLPERSDVPAPQVNSQEKASQTARMLDVTAAKYSSELGVPSSPAPMSDVEQALDMTSQSSTVTQNIPFFVPQPVPVAAPVPGPTPGYAPATSLGLPPPAPVQTGATTEFVQSLGLPMFLVGQNIQALQTLANTPSLLSTFVDGNGMYDQVRLMSLVQTLSQNIAPSSARTATSGFQQSSAMFQPQPPNQTYLHDNGIGGVYGPASGGQYGPAGGTGGFRGDTNSEGNLHLSGYGPLTTQSEIIMLFAPYVKVDEVVMKGTFCFVNTSDPAGAQRAREALAGTLLGGQPVRINVAQRKSRDSGPPVSFNNSASSQTSYYGNSAVAPSSVGQLSAMGGMPGQSNGFGSSPALPTMAPTLPAAVGQEDLSNVRDDRGNPATKNLFVAGYGPGTSEQQLREAFSQHAQIIGIIMKNSFSFVNTSDKGAAIRARQLLSGTMLNGGTLRINFAKETGRLGTSFDLTYGGRTGGGGGGPGASLSHYGRSY